MLPVTRLEVAHGRRIRGISSEAERLIRRAWIAANGDPDRFVEQAIRVAGGARTAVVAEFDAYMAASLTAQGARATVRGLDPDVYRRPVDPEVQWNRPVVQMRTKLAGGMEFPQAFQFGSHMATTMVATDLQFASRGAGRDWMRDDGRVTAWQRVLGSGGTSGKNCGLCIVTSTQVYRTDKLAPIHNHCTCSVRPLVGDTRQRVLDPDNLDAVKAELGQFDGDYASRSDLGRVRIDASDLPTPAVYQHGELGPFLFDATHAPPSLGAAA
jgi:hypothetical protein